MSQAEVTESTVVGSEPLEGEPNTHVVLLKRAVARFDVNAEEVRLGVKTLAAVVITDAATREYAYQMVKAANRSKLLIEATRKGVVKPINDLVKAINEHAATFLTSPLETAIAAVDAKILAFDKEEERKRQEKARELEAEAERIRLHAARDNAILEDKKIADMNAATNSFAARQAEINAMAPGVRRVMAQRELDAAKAAAVGVVEKQAASALQEASIDRSLALSDVRGQQEDLDAEKSKGKTAVWKWEVVDVTKVPDIYKQVAEKLVNEAVRGGTREIPGLRIFSEDKIRH